MKESDCALLEQQHFDAYCEHYEDDLCFSGVAAQYKVKNITDKFAEFLNNAPAGAILEIGAGSGFYTEHLYPKCQNREYVATDISINMLAGLKKRFAKQATPSLTIRQENSLSMQCDNQSIAAVTGHGILHHLPLKESIAEMARILKSGGRIAFYEPNILNPYVWYLFCVKKPFVISPTEMALNPFTVRRILRAAGFTDIKITPYELTMNNTPERWIPFFTVVSRILSVIPILRYWGGSLKITAIKK